ncbi:YesL family protein [Marinicrinis lubricantis]|uniref:YesL family protein n=1 Tax=Marinicrinis lubricantis TaxID=2086470 RepID=A0ABW1IT73_9BACL
MGGFMGGLYRLSEWIMRLAGANVLWFLCSLPVFFVTLVFLYGTTPENAELIADMLANPQQYLISLAIPMFLYGLLAVVFLFPATTALFSVARKWVIGEEDVSVFKTFFRSYKANYKQSLIGGFIYTVVIILIIVNILFYSGSETLSFLSMVFIVLLALVTVSLLNFFSILSHLHMKTTGLVKNALLITLGKPLNSLLMIATNCVIVYFSFRFTFLILFFMGSMMAMMSFWYFHRTFQKIQLQYEKNQESEAAKAEAE